MTTRGSTSPFAEVAAYIPARLGSNRVAAKNLRLLAGRPLVEYVIRTSLTAVTLSAVYVNTESEQIADVARRVGALTYLRDPALAVSTTRTDEILYDFARNIDCGSIVVINPTAPFLTAGSIDAVVRDHLSDPRRTVMTTNRMSKHLVFEGRPVNFTANAPSPRTQDLAPFEYINFLVFAIERQKVISGYEARGYCLYDAPLAFHPLAGIETHDIDEEADFLLAELYLNQHQRPAAYDASIDAAMADGADFKT